MCILLHVLPMSVGAAGRRCSDAEQLVKNSAMASAMSCVYADASSLPLELSKVRRHNTGSRLGKTEHAFLTTQ